jgi:hypothetical protein
MKHKFTTYYLGIIILSTNLIFSQGNSFEKIYPTNGVSYGWDVIERKDGGFLVAGSITPFSTSVLLMNVDINGNLIWEKHLCSGLVRSITYSDSNNYILAGITNNDVLIVKINSLGDTLWTNTINKPTEEYATKIINTSDGGYAITGWLRNKNLDIYLIKTDENCDTLWSKSYGDYETDQGYDIRQLPDNGFIIAGTTRGGSELDFHSSAYVIRTDSIGGLLWTKSYSINGIADCHGIVASNDGGFVLAGSTQDRQNYLNELFLLKIDPQGDSLWIKTYQDNIASTISSIQQTFDGKFVFTGGSGILKTDIGGNIIWSKIINGWGLSIKETSDQGYIISGVSDSNYDILLVKIPKDGISNVEEATTVPSGYVLFQNHPNPFNPETTIKFSVPTVDDVTISIYNITGQLLKEEQLTVPPGTFSYTFDAQNLSSGIYFYQLSTKSGFRQIKKMVFQK